MKFNRALLALGLVLVLVCAPALAHDHDGDDDDDHDDDDHDMTFVSELYAENQVPPLTERDVDDAEAKLKLWSTPQGYRWKFEISDVVNMTMAHIHMVGGGAGLGEGEERACRGACGCGSEGVGVSPASRELATSAGSLHTAAQPSPICRATPPPTVLSLSRSCP